MRRRMTLLADFGRNNASDKRTTIMKALFAVAAAAVTATITLAPVAAFAQDRAGDAVMGAVSGAVVAGPVGAVVGGVIGYTQGPHIAHAMGLRHGHHYYDQNGNRHYTYRNSDSQGSTTR
jgi:hypothetical protein